jgi:predicted alpha/beta hydrolase family esterase
MELCSIPVTKLKFPSIVITSNDDPYINAQRAEFLEKNGKVVPKTSEIRTSQCSITIGLWKDGQRNFRRINTNHTRRGRCKITTCMS